MNRAARSSIPVLTYHSLDGSGSPVSIAPDEFRRQMTALAAAGWRTMTPAELVRGHREGGWPERRFVLTFDDGYRNLIDEAMPVTAAHAFTGVVFVATDRVGGVMAGPGEPAWTPASPLLDWNGLRVVAAAGWSIASHGVSHRAMPSLAPAGVEREMIVSKKTIEDHIGAAVTTLAYPYGAVSREVEAMAASHYDAAFGTVLARARATSRITCLERIDAYYLQGMPIARLDGSALPLYLAVRRAGRALRG